MVFGLSSDVRAQTPFTKTLPLPTAESTPLDTVIINPDPTKCYPTPCTTITLRKEGSTTVIKDGDIKITTTLPLKAGDNKVSVEADGKNETIISPSEAKKVVETISLQKGILPTKIGKIDLTRCEPKPDPESPCDNSSTVYQIETERETKFLGIVPLKSRLDYQIDAANGQVLSETKPWYLQIASFLFRF